MSNKTKGIVSILLGILFIVGLTKWYINTDDFYKDLQSKQRIEFQTKIDSLQEESHKLELKSDSVNAVINQMLTRLAVKQTQFITNKKQNEKTQQNGDFRLLGGNLAVLDSFWASFEPKPKNQTEISTD